MKKRFTVVILSLALLLPQAVYAANDSQPEAAYASTASYVYKNIQSPDVGTVGGEWAVIGLARGGYEVSETYYDSYYTKVCRYVSEHNGVLSNTKYTEYSRVVLALTAIGKDPSDVSGYNLLEPLYDTGKVNAQGLNGAVWALIALDSGSYAVGSDARGVYIRTVLERQLPDGGWALAKTSETSEPDMTAMALAALSGCRGTDDVETAIEKALIYLSGAQKNDGGFHDTGEGTSEACAQVVTALCSLGVSLNDARFVKNGNSVLDRLLAYRTEGGGFAHEQGGAVNAMSTEQALYALAAAKRANGGESGIYRMDDELRRGFLTLLSDMLIEMRTATEN